MAAASSVLGGARLRRVELGTFLKALCGGAIDGAYGASPELVTALGQAALELPLPPHWSEEVDSRGIVYFWHEKRAEATWKHPVLPLFQATLAAAAHVVSTSATIQDAVNGIVAHLRRAERHSAEMLHGWTGPHAVPRPSGEGECEFFYNERTGESTWDNPTEVPQFELYAQFTLFVRILKSLHQSRDGAVAAGQQAGWQGGGWEGGNGWQGTPTPVTSPQAHDHWQQQQQQSPLPTPLATPLPRSGGSARSLSSAGKAGSFPSLLKQELTYPSFMDQELGSDPAGGVPNSGGMLAGMLTAHGLPDELEDYVRWIRLSLASAVPTSAAGPGAEALEAALDAKRPSLPPLTGLNLSQPSAERTFASAGEAAQHWQMLQQHPATAPAQKSAPSSCGRQRTSCSMGPTVAASHGKRSSLPPLTELPLRRAQPFLQRPPAAHAERPQQQQQQQQQQRFTQSPAGSARLKHQRSTPELPGQASPRFGGCDPPSLGGGMRLNFVFGGNGS